MLAAIHKALKDGGSIIVEYTRGSRRCPRAGASRTSAWTCRRHQGGGGNHFTCWKREHVRDVQYMLDAGENRVKAGCLRPTRAVRPRSTGTAPQHLSMNFQEWNEKLFTMRVAAALALLLPGVRAQVRCRRATRKAGHHTPAGRRDSSGVAADPALPNGSSNSSPARRQIKMTGGRRDAGSKNAPVTMVEFYHYSAPLPVVSYADLRRAEKEFHRHRKGPLLQP